jgi:hypothetical protein
MSKLYLIILSFILLFLTIYIFNWGDYLIKNGYIVEQFTSLGPIIDNGSPSTNHTVDLPLTTTTTCQNICGPNNRCSLTGEQCSSDIDCFGCNSKTKQFVPENSPLVTNVRGENDAGKLTTEQTPNYSVLTTDIGTQAKLVGKPDSPPPSYFKGVDTWRETFDAEKELFDKRYSPSAQSFMPNYPKRPTLSGEFIVDGPLAANDFL